MSGSPARNKGPSRESGCGRLGDPRRAPSQPFLPQRCISSSSGTCGLLTWGMRVQTAFPLHPISSLPGPRAALTLFKVPPHFQGPPFLGCWWGVYVAMALQQYLIYPSLHPSWPSLLCWSPLGHFVGKRLGWEVSVGPRLSLPGGSLALSSAQSLRWVPKWQQNTLPLPVWLLGPLGHQTHFIPAPD